MCFSWYRFKVNWIGCRETINFFVPTPYIGIQVAKASRRRSPGTRLFSDSTAGDDGRPSKSAMLRNFSRDSLVDHTAHCGND